MFSTICFQLSTICFQLSERWIMLSTSWTVRKWSSTGRGTFSRWLLLLFKVKTLNWFDSLIKISGRLQSILNRTRAWSQRSQRMPRWPGPIRSAGWGNTDKNRENINKQRKHNQTKKTDKNKENTKKQKKYSLLSRLEETWASLLASLSSAALSSFTGSSSRFCFQVFGKRIEKFFFFFLWRFSLSSRISRCRCFSTRKTQTPLQREVLLQKRKSSAGESGDLKMRILPKNRR